MLGFVAVSVGWKRFPFFRFEEAIDWLSDRFQQEIGSCLRLEISVQDL